MDDDRENKVVLFQSITDENAATSKQYLELCDWDVQQAVDLYQFGGDDGASAAAQAPNVDSDAAMAKALADADLGLGPARFGGSSGSASHDPAAFVPAGEYGMRSSPVPSVSTGGRPASTTSPADVDADGVRAPVKAYRDTLIATPGFPFLGAGGMPGHDMPRVEDVNDSEWMYPPPIKKGNCGGDITYARARAKEAKRWLLVNLLSVDVFDSHRLHRDTWSDDTIQSILDGSFVFWQRTSSCPAGQYFMSLYGIQPDDLPMVCIIGPTGARIFSQTGFIPPDELAMTLVEFLEKHDLDSTVAPTIRDRTRSGSGASEARGGGLTPTTSRTEPRPTSRPSPPPGTASATSQSVAANLGMSEDDMALEQALMMSMQGQANRPSGASSGGAPQTKAEPAVDDSEQATADPHDPITQDGHGARASHLPSGSQTSVRPEPAAGTPSTTRMQLRLANGKTVVRRFYLDDEVRSIYGVICELVDDATSKPFTLQTPIQSVGLLDIANDTLEAHGLTNCKIIMQWDS